MFVVVMKLFQFLRSLGLWFLSTILVDFSCFLLPIPQRNKVMELVFYSEWIVCLGCVSLNQSNHMQSWSIIVSEKNNEWRLIAGQLYSRTPTWNINHGPIMNLNVKGILYSELWHVLRLVMVRSYWNWDETWCQLLQRQGTGQRGELDLVMIHRIKITGSMKIGNSRRQPHIQVVKL